MTETVGQAWVEVLPAAQGFGRRLDSELRPELARSSANAGDTYGRGFADRAGRGIGSRAKSIFSGLAKAGLAVAAVGGAAIGKVLFDSIGEARDAAVVGARTENVIRSMGNAANVTADQVADLAGALSNRAGVDDEAIQSAQNLLLTFGNVRNEVGKGNDIFNQTSALMVDMSRAMGTDMKGSAIQLGKALNDPIKGVSALSRVGVSFTEQQKEQIKSLVESGDMLGAQKIVLGELEKQFGGAAAAMATPADRAKVAWGNFQEELGTVLLPTVDKVLTALADGLPKVLVFGRQVAAVVAPAFAQVRDQVAGFIADALPAIQRLAPVARDLFAALSGGDGGASMVGEYVGYVKQQLASLVEIFRSAIDIITVLWDKFGANILQYLRATFSNLLTVLRGAMQIIQGIFDTVAGILTGDWSRAWEGIKKILAGAWKVIVGLVRQGMNLIRFTFKNAGVVLRAILAAAWKGLQNVVRSSIRAMVNLVRGLPGQLVAALRALPGVLRKVLSSAFSTAIRVVTAAGGQIVDAVRRIPGRLTDLGRFFLNAGRSLIRSFLNGLSEAGSFVSNLVGNVWNAIKGFLNTQVLDRIDAAISFKVDWPGPGSFSFNPDIPRLATGGRAADGALVMIGDGREPESVLPDSMLRTLVSDVTAAAGVGGSGNFLATVTNWDEGIFFFESIAEEAVDNERELVGQTRRAR